MTTEQLEQKVHDHSINLLKISIDAFKKHLSSKEIKELMEERIDKLYSLLSQYEKERDDELVTRLRIVVGRLRACNETTLKHDLTIDEVNDWIAELELIQKGQE